MNPSKLKTCLRMALVVCGTQAGLAALAGTSFKGGDLGNPDDWTAGLPDANTALTFYGATKATNASQNVVAKSLELAHSSAKTVWNLGSHKMTANVYAFGSGNSIHNVNFFLTGGSLVATTYNAVYIGGNGAHDNTTVLDNATLDLSTEGRVMVGQGSGADNNTFLVGTNATLLIGLRGIEAGQDGSGNTTAFVGSKEVSVAGNVIVGNSATACNNKLIMRDVETATIGGNIYLGYSDGAVGNSMLVSNVTALTTSGMYVGFKGACATGEVYLAEGATTLPTINVGSYASSSNSYCLVDGAGASISAFALTTHVKLNVIGSVVEYRNLTLTTSDVLANTASDRHWIFGPGATFASTYTGYSPLPLYGANTGMTVDGGALSFPNSNGSIWLGNRSYGEGTFFVVKNGGTVNIHNNLQVGSDKCRVDVLSSSTFTAAGNFLCNGSDNTLTISNATMHVAGFYAPDNDDADGYKGWATNNVFRFAGTTPQLKVDGNLWIWWKKIGDEYTSAPIFEFVIPKNGYETVPVTANSIWFRSTNRPRLHVDASAYKGDRKWMTLMRAPTLSVADWNAFISEIPENCRVQLVTVGENKEVQLQVRNPRGMCVLFY